MRRRRLAPLEAKRVRWRTPVLTRRGVVKRLAVFCEREAEASAQRATEDARADVAQVHRRQLAPFRPKRVCRRTPAPTPRRETVERLAFRCECAARGQRPCACVRLLEAHARVGTARGAALTKALRSAQSARPVDLLPTFNCCVC